MKSMLLLVVSAVLLVSVTAAPYYPPGYGYDGFGHQQQQQQQQQGMGGQQQQQQQQQQAGLAGPLSLDAGNFGGLTIDPTGLAQQQQQQQQQLLSGGGYGQYAYPPVGNNYYNGYGIPPANNLLTGLTAGTGQLVNGIFAGGR